MRELQDLLCFLVALDTLTDRYAKHEIDREEYLSTFDKLIAEYEAIK